VFAKLVWLRGPTRDSNPTVYRGRIWTPRLHTRLVILLTICIEHQWYNRGLRVPYLIANLKYCLNIELRLATGGGGRSPSSGGRACPSITEKGICSVDFDTWGIDPESILGGIDKESAESILLLTRDPIRLKLIPWTLTEFKLSHTTHISSPAARAIIASCFYHRVC
jgi:hypothetical protein